MARCIWAPPQSEGALQLQFDGVPAGEAIVGFYGIVESGKSSAAKPTNFKVGVDGVFRHTGKVKGTQQISEFQIPLEEAADGEAIDVVFDVRAPNIKKRHFCFNAQVVDLVSSAEPPPAAGKGDASP
jgi:hypothetical protein